MKYLLLLILLHPNVTWAYSRSLEVPDFHLQFRKCKSQFIVEKEVSPEFITTPRSFKCNRANDTILCTEFSSAIEYPLYFVKNGDLDYDLKFQSDDGSEEVRVNEKRAEYTKTVKKGTIQEITTCRGAYFDATQSPKVMILDISEGLSQITKFITGNEKP